MIVNELEIDAEEAQKLLLKYGSVKNAIENYKTSPYGAISAVKTNNLERTSRMEGDFLNCLRSPLGSAS
jgi:hypothetical protein